MLSLDSCARSRRKSETNSSLAFTAPLTKRESLTQEVADLERQIRSRWEMIQAISPEDLAKEAQILTEDKRELAIVSPPKMVFSSMDGRCFVITDYCLPDNPIVFATDSFLKLTGFSKSEVFGINCRFLQGPGTDREAARRLKNAVVAGKEVHEVLLNYTKSGDVAFWNDLVMSPLRNSKGEITQASSLIKHGCISPKIEPSFGES